MSDHKEPLDPEAAQEAVRQLQDDEQRREAKNSGCVDVSGLDGVEVLVRVGAEAIDTVGNVVGTVAKVGVEVVGQIIGGALDGL